MMGRLRQSGFYELTEKNLEFIKSEFNAGMTTETETLEMIKSVYAKCGYLLDPHSAVALNVAERFSSSESPMISLATAHASKFPSTVQKATGVYPALPEWTGSLMEDKENFTALKNNQAEVEAFILTRMRAARRV